MNALLQLLKDNPNCRVTINCRPARTRTVPREGDVKWMKKGSKVSKRYVRRPEMATDNGGRVIGYAVRRGKQRYFWNQEDEPNPKTTTVH